MPTKQEIFERGVKAIVEQGDLGFILGPDVKGVKARYRIETESGKISHCVIGANISDFDYSEKIEGCTADDPAVYNKVLNLDDYKGDDEEISRMIIFLEEFQNSHDDLCCCLKEVSPQSRLRAFLSDAAEIARGHGIDLTFYDQFPKHLIKGIQL